MTLLRSRSSWRAALRWRLLQASGGLVQAVTSGGVTHTV